MLIQCSRRTIGYNSSLLVGASGKITSWCVKMEDPKLDKNLVGPTKNWCIKIKGGYM